MAFVLNDRVKETTTTTGTGTINLAGAATGFETFVAGIGNSNVTYYCIAGQGTAEFEVGIGTVTDASPDTLSRTTILSSSNSDSAVDFSAGTKDVFCTLPASKTIRELDTALNVPTGTTAQRASSPAAGDLRFNTTSSKFEGYSGSAWGNIGEGNFLVTNIFAGDGSDTTFTISNAVANENNLLVFIDGVFQAHDSYSVSGTTVTFSTAPANGRVITIYSALNNVQGADMVIATMTGDNSDTTLALGVTPVSENNVQVYIDGTYQNKDTYSISGQTLTFSTAPPTGTAVEAITHTVTDISAAASSVLVDEFTGDGSDTTFTLSAAPANENNTQVFVGGVYQEKATYSISNAVLTFSTAPANGVSIEVVSIAVGQINSAVQLADADGDTKVMVEESSDEDKIRFDTGGTERMIIDSTGVGIDTSPSEKLTVSGKTQSSEFRASQAAGGKGYDFTASGSGAGLANMFCPAGYTLGFGTNSTERMRIDASGDVLVGTTTINTGTLGTSNKFLEVAAGTASGSGTLILSRNTSTNDVELGGVRFVNANNADDDGLDADGKLVAAVSARSVTSDSNAGDDSGANLIFYTKPEAGNYAERMRIDSTGALLVGTTSQITTSTEECVHIKNGDGAGQLFLDNTRSSGNQYMVQIHRLGTRVGSIQTSTSGTSYLETSDYRLKENVDYEFNALERVAQLKPARFNFIVEPDVTVDGFLAHEVSPVVPQAVSGEKDAVDEEGNPDLQGIDHSKLVPLLTKAIQELSAKVEELEGKIK